MVLLRRGNWGDACSRNAHALAEDHSTRRVLWLHAARDGQHHSFAAEVRRLDLALAHSRSFVCYSTPGSQDKVGKDFEAAGHLSRSVFEKIGIPAEADVYMCGPTHFWQI